MIEHLWKCAVSLALLGPIPGIAAASLAEAWEEEETPAVRAEDLRRWLGALAGDDAVARELASQQLIAAGSSALPLLEPLLTRASSAEFTLAVRRVYGGIVGVSPELAAQVKGRVAEVRDSDSARTLPAVARWIVEQGDRAVQFALRQLEGGSVPLRLVALRRRLTTMIGVRDLAAGKNLGDEAARKLSTLGVQVVEDLAALSHDRALPLNWRMVAAERMLYLGGERAFSPALGLAGSERPELVRLVVPSLCRAASAEQFEVLAPVLFDLLPRDATVAASISDYGDRLGDDVLRGHLDAVRGSTRGLAARLLGERRDRKARPQLAKLLRDDNVRLVQTAAVALGRIGDEDDLEALTRLLSHAEPSARRAGVQAITAVAAPRSVAWLSTALRDADASVRAAAARNLGRAGDEEAVGVLVHSLVDEEPSVVAAATASLASLTGVRDASSVTASSRKELERVRQHWSRWWAERLSEEEEQAQKEREGEDKEKQKDSDQAREDDPSAPLASEGRRILETLGRTLRRDFRPYGDLKEQDGTDSAALLRAAQDGMRQVMKRKKEEDDPERLLLEMASDEQRILAHLLKNGSFRDVGDLAAVVGALPVKMQAQDYILLVYEAADAMVRSLGDRFTRLQTMEDAMGKVDPEFLPSLFGKGRSIGLMVEKYESSLRVEFVLGLSVADRAGLRPGDRILSLNGELAVGLEMADVQRKLHDKVSLSVLRDGWTRPVPFELEPEENDPEQLVTGTVLPGRIGYLRLQQFDLGCAQKLEWKLRELEQEGIDALIFDLRGNPGGTVLDAVAIVDKFVPVGETITTTWMNSSDPDEDHREEVLRSTDSETDRTYPLAVLVSKCSASASEMTSGALQDLERCTVVGRTTWGKGIGQSSAGVAGFSRRSLFGETRTSLSLGITVLEYFLPTGRTIQGLGVEPDVPVLMPVLLGDRFEQMRRARQHPRTQEFVDDLLESDPELAARLGAYDSWDPDEYPAFNALRDELRLELSNNLVRRALRDVLRERLAREDPELLLVDLQEDDDVRSAVAELAAQIDLDPGEIPVYEDLAE